MVEVRRYPTTGGVAGLAIVAAVDMGGVLAYSRSAVMTTEAGAHDIGMIDPDHRTPGGVAMAVLADIRGRDVASVLAGGRGAVVAARTVGRGAGVVEIGRYPAIGGMTGLTVIAAVDMRRVFTGSGGAVVAAETGTDHVTVINPGHR